MVDSLNEEQEQEVERLMNLAWGWLDSWDVVGEGEQKTPPHVRVCARLQLKTAISALVCKAMPN